MIVVSYNERDVKTDNYAKIAKKGRNSIGVKSVKELAEKLEPWSDHSITTLIIADHGASGAQGVGSGANNDYSQGTNLSSAYIKASEVTPEAVPEFGAHGTNAEPMMGYLMRQAKKGVTGRFQSGHLDSIARKIKIGGNLLLAGCSVGSVGGGLDGPALLKSIGLLLQNSVRVAACPRETWWTDETAPTIWPALAAPGYPKLTGRDLIGFMGARALTEAELDDVLANCNILSTGN